MDATLGLLIALTLIAFSVSTAAPETSALEHLQLADLGDAMSTVLNEKGVLATHDSELMQSEINASLSSNAAMRIELTCDSGISTIAGLELPQNKFIASGVRYFTITSFAGQDDPCFARWWTWSR